MTTLELEGDLAGTAYECLDHKVTIKASRNILRGKTYPALEGIGDVATVLDIGANCGAASVYFACSWPGATIHAFEPAQLPFGFLARNAGHHPQIRAHHVGLFDRDDSVELHHGRSSPGSSSIFASGYTGETSETITLRSASSWLAEHDISDVDVIKIDTEGCELQVLADITHLLGDTKVVYFEFHSEADRAAIHELLDPTHRRVIARQLIPETGEHTYVHRSLDVVVP